MMTIKRHPVPADSYEPNRPLNDLGRDQLKHMIHAAERLPAHLRIEGPPPSPEDGPACTRFITAVTERLLEARKHGLVLVNKKTRKAASPANVLDIAATAAGKSEAKKTARPGNRKQRKGKP